MALIKQKVLKSGVTGEYWKMTRVVVEKDSLKAYWTISLYLNKTVADSEDGVALMSLTTSRDISSEEAVGNLLALGYAQVKAVTAAPTRMLLSGDPDPTCLPDLKDAADA